MILMVQSPAEELPTLVARLRSGEFSTGEEAESEIPAFLERIRNPEQQLDAVAALPADAGQALSNACAAIEFSDSGLSE